MKSEIRDILESTTKKLFSTEIEAFDVSRTKLKTHGNWSSNIALVPVSYTHLTLPTNREV